jgi:glucosamine kinase
MLLVADSGSTKADWLLAQNGKVIDSFFSMGFNPFFHDEKIVQRELSKNPKVKKYASGITEVNFFGSGCSSPSRNKIIAAGLKKVFPKAKIRVDHDMLGAALAACHNNAGLVCILGTGSNIAYYDGKKLSKTRHGLGYVLGDENSGSFYGKRLISSYLYEIMPADLSKSFYNKYKITKEKAIKNVYHNPDANVYLASFAKFLSEHKTHLWIAHLVYKGMIDFFETHISAYSEYKTAPVHFIGSIAFHFSDVLKQVASEKKFTVGKIIVKPVDDLMDYFLKYNK